VIDCMFDGTPELLQLLIVTDWLPQIVVSVPRHIWLWITPKGNKYNNARTYFLTEMFIEFECCLTLDGQVN